jgi:high-affinity iron transporter
MTVSLTREQVLAGASVGLFVAFALGAAFIAVWFTKASNLWLKAELLWEGQYPRPFSATN